MIIILGKNDNFFKKNSKDFYYHDDHPNVEMMTDKSKNKINNVLNYLIKENYNLPNSLIKIFYIYILIYFIFYFFK